MKLRLEATAEELHAKSGALLKSLASEIQLHNPELADVLRKAAQPPVQKPRFKAMRQLTSDVRKRYLNQVDAMLKDIEKVLLEPKKAINR